MKDDGGQQEWVGMFCFAVALRLLCDCFAIALQLLCSSFAIALQLLCSCCAVRLLCSSLALSLQLLRSRFRFLYNHLSCCQTLYKRTATACYRFAIAVESLCTRFAITVQIAVQSHCNRVKIGGLCAFRSFCNRCTIVCVKKRNLYAVDTQSTCDHSAIASQSLHNCFEIDS
jgi:hypothetical protein